jgi:hypothetical protein
MIGGIFNTGLAKTAANATALAAPTVIIKARSLRAACPVKATRWATPTLTNTTTYTPAATSPATPTNTSTLTNTSLCLRRLTQETGIITNTYSYDFANRLASVDGVPYTWDAEFAAGKPGNLLSDGA